MFTTFARWRSPEKMILREKLAAQLFCEAGRETGNGSVRETVGGAFRKVSEPPGSVPVA